MFRPVSSVLLPLSLVVLRLPLLSSGSHWPLIGHRHPILASDWLAMVQFAQQLAGAPVDRNYAPGLVILVTKDLMEVRDLFVSVTRHHTCHAALVTEAVLCSVAIT